MSVNTMQKRELLCHGRATTLTDFKKKNWKSYTSQGT